MIGVRRRVATAAVDLVAPRVWVVDDTGFAKDGPASACVARQYSGTLGKVGNCQIAVSLHAAPLSDLVHLAKSRWRIEHDYRELKTGLGLDHFEGRSWIGWHRHVTLAAAAQLFLTQLRLTDPKAAGQP